MWMLKNFPIFKKGTWNKVHETCCSLGLRPISFQTTADLKCLSDYVKSSQWNLNFNYWTGGLKLNDTWWWCPEKAVKLSGDMIWTQGQPDNKNLNESCMHLFIDKKSGNIEFSDRSCSNQFVMGCMVNIIF
jgi:hypothetical protein